MTITSHDLKAALERVAAQAKSNRDMLCAADAQLGDGDLGITVADAFAACAKLDLPDDVGRAFFEMAKAFQSVSSSSFGTLVATGLMAAAKELKGKTSFETSDIAGLLTGARDAMLARGKSALGEKTVLDGIDAQAKALEEGGDQTLERAISAAKGTVDGFLSKKN